MRDRGVIRSWAGLGMNWLLCEFIKADSVGGKGENEIVDTYRFSRCVHASGK